MTKVFKFDYLNSNMIILKASSLINVKNYLKKFKFQYDNT